ncbi:MAG TPA: hypothetical protein VIH90_01020 [Candidatus Saccharimonadales bacterium]
MTKKDYIKAASILYNERCNFTFTANEKHYVFTENSAQWCRIVQSLADWFANDNKRFDRERFLNACGMTHPLT